VKPGECRYRTSPLEASGIKSSPSVEADGS
jgi:hypothetical protein